MTLTKISARTNLKESGQSLEANVGRELTLVVSTHPRINDQEAVREAIQNWIIPALVKRFLAENMKKVTALDDKLASSELIDPRKAKSQ